MREAKLKVENDLEVEVKYIGVVKLSLESGFEIFLENIFYVPSFRKKFDFCFLFTYTDLDLVLIFMMKKLI